MVVSYEDAHLKLHEWAKERPTLNSWGRSVAERNAGRTAVRQEKNSVTGEIPLGVDTQHRAINCNPMLPHCGFKSHHF